MMEEKLCRLCGSEEGIFVDIFEKGADRVKKINKTLPIWVNEQDPFPKQICHHCSYKLDQFYEFRLKTIQTHESLRRKVPWLNNDLRPFSIVGDPPMVKVITPSRDVVSPSEELKNASSESMYDEDEAILIEDSPPYFEPPNVTEPSVSEFEHEQNPSNTRKSEKTESQFLKEKKKKKKKERKTRRKHEDRKIEQACQNLNNIENDPLRLSPFENIENNSFENIVENNSCAVKSPKSELCVVEKGILTDDKGGGNIALPKYMLVTKIPRVGTIYTCEKCGVTFLTRQLATQHTCGRAPVADVDESPKEEVQHNHETQQHEDTAKVEDFYKCIECSHVFTRHSQLVSHMKKHSNKVEFSSDDLDSIKPFKKRKRHYSKKMHKPRLLNTNHFNPTGISSPFKTCSITM